ncbi:molybdenum cofactor sulfurase [Pectinophora gossypiella]|uniref:molybdenum cofactor sulfurase n=1 Tax=Pectinophora gossypiella TaxID=13191 RepID=UPI00214EEBB2|nr:molybdenum cofactor sulfurase [Pectinophora gossypiella]
MTPLSKVINNDDMQKIRAEFSRLGDRCYLENAGATLYPQGLLERINEDLMTNVYMNPHTDKYTKDCIEQIRYMILQYFNTDPTEYSVIFTSGTTQSLKLVVESFQFACDPHEVVNCGSFVYLRDNHTSVLGLREIASDKNADIIHISHDDFLTYLDPQQSTPTSKWKEKYKNEGNTLLVYPAQSNFNGYKYPLDAIDNIKDGCLNNYIKKHLCKVNCNWYVLLDAASFVATNKLDLSRTRPDFVCLSFYKIFGYPTGLGALLVRNSSVHVLNQKRYFGGGTVDVVLSSEDYHVKRKLVCERFEDGTHPFLAIIALKHCFDLFNELIPKIINNDIMETISHHTYYLAQDLYNQLRKLEHQNGIKAAVLYLDSAFTDIKVQGSIVTFNLVRDDKAFIGYAEFQHMADLFGINVRTGCFCNSGSCQRHLQATNKEMKDMYKAGHKCGDDFDLINGKPTGAIRASFSYYNTFDDVDQLMLMICRCFVPKKFKRPKRQMTNYKAPVVKETKRNNSEEKIKMFYEPQGYKTVDIPDSLPITDKIVLNEMAIFPIKSCGAFKIKSTWKLGNKGFEYDRQWMIIKDNGVCLTQKQNTRMCLIRPRIDLKQKTLILSFKGKPSISIPLEPKQEMWEKEATMCQTRVCSDTVKCIDCGDEVANWISEALEVSYLRLIMQSDDTRKQKKKNNREKSTEDRLLSLSNQAQYLLINKATVRWLSSKIDDSQFFENIDDLTDRFRANLVIDMDKELVETEWQRLIIGKHEFKVEGLCTRCQMVCIDQHTGEKTVEPLRTISALFEGKLRFGIYLSYVGAVDGSKDNKLKNYSPIQPINIDEDISR